MNLSAAMTDDLAIAASKVKRARTPQLWAISSLQEGPVIYGSKLCDTPEAAAEYWRESIATDARYNREVETLAVLLLNSRRRVKGHVLVSQGTLDTVLCHPREIFRVAIVAAAAAVILMHNHPSGDSTPSEADIKMTRDTMRAGQLLKIEVLDHVIVGQPMPDRPRAYVSLRELGYFYS